MKYLLAIWLLLICFLSASTEIYKLVKQDGTVVYSDRPLPGAVKVQLSNTNSAQMPSLAPNKKATSSVKKTVKPLPNYQLSLRAPADGATLRNNSGNMVVVGELTPSAPGEYQLFINGQLVAQQTSPSIHLENIDRGELKLQLKFIHHTGKILASSKEHTVYLHQASRLINAN